jgi:hypothetical protein
MPGTHFGSGRFCQAIDHVFCLAPMMIACLAPPPAAWREGLSGGLHEWLWTSGRAWTTLKRCPHAHSNNSKLPLDHSGERAAKESSQQTGPSGPTVGHLNRRIGRVRVSPPENHDLAGGSAAMTGSMHHGCSTARLTAASILTSSRLSSCIEAWQHQSRQPQNKTVRR